MYEVSAAADADRAFDFTAARDIHRGEERFIGYGYDRADRQLDLEPAEPQEVTHGDKVKRRRVSGFGIADPHRDIHASVYRCPRATPASPAMASRPG